MMSNTVPFFALLFILVILVFLLSALLSVINNGHYRESDGSAKSDGNSAKHEEHDSIYHPLAATIENAINSYSRYRQSDDREKSGYEKYSLVLATVTLIFAVVAVGAAVYSATLAIDQNDINRTALIAVQRAFSQSLVY